MPAAVGCCGEIGGKWICLDDAVRSFNSLYSYLFLRCRSAGRSQQRTGNGRSEKSPKLIRKSDCCCRVSVKKER